TSSSSLYSCTRTTLVVSVKCSLASLTSDCRRPIIVVGALNCAAVAKSASLGALTWCCAPYHAGDCPLAATTRCRLSAESTRAGMSNTADTVGPTMLGGGGELGTTGRPVTFDV